MVDYYGSPMPINQVATVSVPESRLLVIQPWDRSLIKDYREGHFKIRFRLEPVFGWDSNSVTYSKPYRGTAPRSSKVARKKAEGRRLLFAISVVKPTMNSSG